MLNSGKPNQVPDFVSLPWVALIFHLLPHPLPVHPIQNPNRPPERFRLHVRVRLRGQPDVRVSRQVLHREGVFGLVTENPFAPGLRSVVTSCHKLALPVHLEEGLTG